MHVPVCMCLCVLLLAQNWDTQVENDGAPPHEDGCSIVSLVPKIETPGALCIVPELLELDWPWTNGCAKVSTPLEHHGWASDGDLRGFPSLPAPKSLRLHLKPVRRPLWPPGHGGGYFGPSQSTLWEACPTSLPSPGPTTCHMDTQRYPPPPLSNAGLGTRCVQGYSLLSMKI